MAKTTEKTSDSFLRDVLRSKGYRATPGKIALLRMLKESSHPLTIAEILVKIKNAKDTTTLYRSLDALVDSGVLRKVHFKERGARYEWHMDRSHHHHIVCEDCGKIEDVDICDTGLDKEVLKQAKSFKKVKGHSIEFFGYCATCAKK